MPTAAPFRCSAPLARVLQALALLALSFAVGACTLLPNPPTNAQAPAARPTATPRPQATPRPRATATPRPQPTARPQATARPKPQPTARPAVAIDGFESVAAEQLPEQARQTLALIARGGPFPYRQDGALFQNRERRLPRQPSGYYHEYTVETPGSDDRGARRIITGAKGEIFYTADHYESFIQVLPS